MERIFSDRQKPIYNTNLPYIDETLLFHYNTISYLLNKLTTHGSIFSYFENLKRDFTKESPLLPYKDLLSNICLIKQIYPDLPFRWRKELKKIENWILDHLLITKINSLNKQINLLQKAEISCFDQPNKTWFNTTSPHVKNTYLIAQKTQKEDFDHYTLTGKVTRVEINKRISYRLETNLKFANEIIRYVQGIIKYSSNYLARNPLIAQIINDPLKSKKIEQLDKEICNLFLKTEPFIRFGYLSYYNKDFQKILTLLKIGNCREMSLLGLRYAKEKNIFTNVQLFSIKNGDHFFLVIDSSHETDAVICDPWSGTYGPITELDSLIDYIKFDISIYRPIVKLVPFSQMESIYAKDPFFLIHFDENLIEEGNIVAVSEFLSLNDTYINNIKVYNQFLQKALDFGHPEIILLLLEKGDHQKIHPILKMEILSFSIKSFLNKKNKKLSYISVIFKIEKILIFFLAFTIISKTKKIK